ncbi:MAG: hypothetical protein M3O35_13190 [Acidobacteriota bacterium]|nr:hypothetical protein [Acidobacteriota bacterium]
MPPSIRVDAIIKRKDPRLPRFIVVPSDAVEPWKLAETTTVTGNITVMISGGEVSRNGTKSVGLSNCHNRSANRPASILVIASS